MYLDDTDIVQSGRLKDSYGPCLTLHDNAQGLFLFCPGFCTASLLTIFLCSPFQCDAIITP
jgi:hypothetical protein